MVTLDELAKIVKNKESKYERELKRANKKQIDEHNKEYLDIIHNLSGRLKDAATDGLREYTVAQFSAFGFGLNQTLLDGIRVKKSGNYYCAWVDKEITEQDVIEHMTGNLKRVYDYLKENNLNPHIDYWTDGGGMDEGFRIKIKW